MALDFAQELVDLLNHHLSVEYAGGEEEEGELCLTELDVALKRNTSLETFVMELMGLAQGACGDGRQVVVEEGAGFSIELDAAIAKAEGQTPEANG